MPVSTRGRPAKFRQPRQGRPIYTPDDPGRYVRCQYCGFPCDTKRDKLSDRGGEVVTIANPYKTYYTTDAIDVYIMGEKPTDEVVVIPREILETESASESYHATGFTDIYTTKEKSTVRGEIPVLLDDLYTISFTKSAYIPISSQYTAPTIEIIHNCPACGGQYTKRVNR